MSDLDLGSLAILNYVNMDPGYVDFFRVINAASRETGTSHSENWYFRRLVALALEGRIEAQVHRDGDKLAFRFRRLPGGPGEAGGRIK